jgi:hypothetical protein
MNLPASLRVLLKNANAIQFYRNRGWIQYLESETHIYFGWSSQVQT